MEEVVGLHLMRVSLTRRIGLYSYADLENENKELLLMRWESRTEVGESATICLPVKIIAIKIHLLQKNL
jgi:hypothetical protein